MLCFFAALLAVDRSVDARGQLMLGIVTWAVLVGVVRRLPALPRAQVAVVVLVASLMEVVGSILWGVYAYRLGNLPMFVPPAHGLVYLAGLHLSRSRLVAAKQIVFVAAVLVVGLAWMTAGLTILPRQDVAGTIGLATFALVVLCSRARATYCGVFLAVAALEWYGTALGTWQWAETIPGLGLPDGNPPSGVASGYVLFDVAALAFAPRLLGLVERGQAWACSTMPLGWLLELDWKPSGQSPSAPDLEVSSASSLAQATS